VSDKILLDNKKAQTLLTHNLHKQSKDDHILHRELAKKRKDTQDSEDVGVIAAGIRHKQMGSSIPTWAVQCPCEFGLGKFYFLNILNINL
jgi:hypothetical protein